MHCRASTRGFRGRQGQRLRVNSVSTRVSTSDETVDDPPAAWGAGFHIGLLIASPLWEVRTLSRALPRMANLIVSHVPRSLLSPKDNAPCLLEASGRRHDRILLGFGNALATCEESIRKTTQAHLMHLPTSVLGPVSQETRTNSSVRLEAVRN